MTLATLLLALPCLLTRITPLPIDVGCCPHDPVRSAPAAACCPHEPSAPPSWDTACCPHEPPAAPILDVACCPHAPEDAVDIRVDG